MAQSFTFISNSPARTRALGKKIAAACGGGEVFFLDGDLGAGKTCLTQGIAQGLKISAPITSPTFVTHQEYRVNARLALEHFDFYRLSAMSGGGEEFTDFFNHPDMICVIEWAQMLPAILPREHINIKIIATTARQREISLAAIGQNAIDFLARLRPSISPSKRTHS